MNVARTEVERRIQRLLDQCRRRGMKITHQRMEIFRELASTGEHPDAESIYRQLRKRMPTISRDTVYRTLSALVDQGLVQKVEPHSEGARYDANPDRHHHFICTVCGSISDFCSNALNRLPIPKSVQAMGQIEVAQVQVRGICRACMKHTPKGRKGKSHD
jgi:Fur family peroxide stress response transcriptional regulator